MPTFSEQFHNWAYNSVLPQAVSYELPQIKQKHGLLDEIYKVFIKIMDCFFSLSEEYNRERASLKVRLITQISKENSTAASPPLSLRNRVSVMPEIELGCTFEESTISALPESILADDEPYIVEESFEIIDFPFQAPIPPILSHSPVQEAKEVSVSIPLGPSMPQKTSPKTSPAQPSRSRSYLAAAGKVAKVAIFSGLAMGGAFFAKEQVTETAYTSLVRQRAGDDNVFQLGLQIEGLAIDLQNTRWQQRTNETVNPLVQSHLSQLHSLQSTLDQSETNLEDLAHRVDELRAAIGSSYITVPIKGSTPLAALAEGIPQIRLGEQHLQTLLEATHTPPIEEGDAIAYLRERLRGLGENSEIQKAAARLDHALSIYTTFSQGLSAFAAPTLLQLTSAESAIQQAQTKLTAAQEKQQIKHAKAKLEETIEHAKADIRDGWIKSLHILKSFLSIQLLEPKSFMLPGGTEGEILLFIPNTDIGCPNSWTVRFYSRHAEDSSNLHYHPYSEKRAVSSQELTSDIFVSALATPLHMHVQKFAETPNALSYLPWPEGSPFTQLMHSPQTPTIPSLYERSMPPKQGLQSSLNDLLYVELSPESALDFQISSLKHYMDQAENILKTNSHTYQLVKNSLSDLAQACVRASKSGWISSAAFADKSQILHDMQVKLAHDHLHLRSHLRSQAPSVIDESAGRRVVSSGQIPDKLLRPLQTRSVTHITPSKYQQPLSLVPTGTSLPVVPSHNVRSDDIHVFAKKITQPSEAPTAFTQFRSWALAIFQKQSVLDTVTPEHATKMLNSLENLSQHIPKIDGKSTQDIAASLAEIASVADLLMSRLDDPILQKAHMPLPQIMQQLQNSALFGNTTVSSILSQRAEIVASSKAEPFFAQAIGDPQAQRYNTYDRNEEPAPWGYERLRSLPSKSELPPHILYAQPEGRYKQPTTFGTVAAYVKGANKPKTTLPKEFIILKSIAENVARFNAITLVRQAQNVAQQFAQNSLTNPHSFLDAIREWTQFINPKAIAGTTLEMLSKEEADQLLAALGQISAAFFQANFRASIHLADPNTMLSFLEILTMADRVLAYSPDTLHNFYRLPLESFHEIIDGSNPFYRTFDPAMDLRLQGVREWYHERTHTPHDRTLHKSASPLFKKFNGFFAAEGQDLQEHKGLHLPPELELPFYTSDRQGYTRLSDFRTYDIGDHSPNPEALTKGLMGYLGQDSRTPPWFFQVRDLTHAAYHALRSGFINPHPDASTPQDFMPVVERDSSWYSFSKTAKVKHHLTGITREDLQQYQEIPDGETRGHLFAHLEPPLEDGVLKELRDLHLRSHETPNSDYKYRPGIDALPRSIYDENIAMAQDADARRLTYSSQQYRIKRSMRGEPDVQIFKTITQYLDNPGWLSSADERIEFLNLLFDPGLLHRYLLTPQAGPEALKNLSKFLSKQFKLHQGKSEMQLFFTEAAIRLNQYATYAQQTAPEMYPSLPPELNELCQVPTIKLQTVGLRSEERSAYGALRAISFLTKQTLSVEEVPQFLNAVIFYHRFASHPMVNVLHIDRQIDMMLKRFAPQILSALYPNETLNPSVIHAALKGILDNPEQISFTPSSENPFLFSNAQGTLDLDLLEGSLVQQGMSGSAMPMEARLSPAYKMIFGASAYRGTYLDRHTFEFADAQGNGNVLQKDNASRHWHLYRKIDSGMPFQMVSREWSAWNAQTCSQENIKWLKSNWMLSRYTQWHRGGTFPEVRLIDHQGNEAYRIALGGDAGKIIQGIYKKGPGKSQELLLADIDQESYRWVKEFEDPHFAHVWLDGSTQKGIQIEFPRFGDAGLTLTFKAGRWHLDSEPQYYVADPQFNPLFPGESTFLRLRTTRGAERLLIPRLKPVLGKDGYLTFDRAPTSSQAQKVLFVDKNPRSGKYEGSDPETNLYLAFLHTAYRDYGRAHDLLTSLLGHNRRLPKEAMEILGWLIDGTHLPIPTDTPQAIGIRTLAAHLKSRNIEKNPLHEGERYDVPQPLQDRYLRIIEDISHLRLPLAEEAMLFKNFLLADNDLPIEQAVAQMQLSNPLAAREALDAVLPKLLYGGGPRAIRLPKGDAQPVRNTAVVTARPKPIEFSNLVAFSATSKNMTASVASLFDKRSSWYKKLAGPTQKLFEDYEKGVAEFLSQRNVGNYKIQDKQQFAAARASLEKAEREFTLELETLKLRILELANPFPANPQEANRLMLQLEAGTARPVNLEQLLSAFSKDDLRRYVSLNPALSMETARELDSLIEQFIDLVPDWQHYKQQIDAMREVEIVALQSDTVEGQALLQQALRNFKAATEAGRAFKSGPRLMKVMEFQTGTYYRGGQVTGLVNLGMQGLEGSLHVREGSKVHRITVGAGKTSRLLPSRLQAYAEEGVLALAIMPEAQLASAGKEFTHIMREVYGVPTLELEFTRKRLTPDALESTVKAIKEALAKGHPVLTSGKSLRVLRNLLIEHYKIYVDKAKRGEDTIEQGAIVKHLREIRKLMKTKPIIDEVHKEYDPRIETNHPFGEAQSLPPEYGIISLNLFEILRDDPTIQKAMHFNFIPQMRQPSAEPFTKERFEAEIAPILAQKFIEKLLNKSSIDKELLPLADFLKTLTPQQLHDVTNYVLPKSQVYPERNKLPRWIEDLSKSIRDQIAMIRGELCLLMPQTLDHNFGERYGFARPGDILITPFSSAGRPNKNSKFSLFGESYNYQLQANFHEGLRRAMINQIISELRHERIEELSHSKDDSIPLGQRCETEADREFQRLFNDRSLNLDSPHLEEQMATRAANSPSLIRHLIKTYALPQVKYFPQNLKATSQHLGNIFESWQGFSGTPTNYQTYPGDFKKPGDQSVVGRMLTLIAEQTVGAVHTLDIRNPNEVFAHPTIKSADAFMDAGGLFATEDLEKLADQWGESVGKARVRISSEGIVIKQHVGERSIPLRAADSSPTQRVALYDQPNIVGTDIQHRRNAKGVVSVSKGMTFTELEQAAGRMRGIESGQKVELLVLEDDAIVMRQKLGLQPGQALSNTDVMRYLIANESEKQMADSEVALRHKLRAIIDNYVFNWLSGEEIDSRRNGLEELLDQVFFPPVTTSPFELFGKPETEQPRETAFKAEIDRLIDQFAPSFKMVFGDNATKILLELREKMEKVLAANIESVRETIVSRPATDMEQEQELLQEQETEVEEEQETELEQEQFQYPSKAAIRPHKLWYTLTPDSVASWDFWQAQAPHGARLLAIRDIMKMNKQSETLSDLFDASLLVSNNYQQNAPLTAPQKPAQFVAVVKNLKTDEYRVAFADSYDAVRLQDAWHAHSGVDLPQGPGETGGRIVEERYSSDSADPILSTYFQMGGLYTNSETTRITGKASRTGDTDMWVGSLSGRQAFGTRNIFSMQDARLRKLWAQAQIFGGRFNFEGDQQLRQDVKTWLQEWANSKATLSKSQQAWLAEAEAMVKKLHASQEDLISRFGRTDLGRIFTELRAES